MGEATMKMWDVYSFLWDLQEAIGDNCKVCVCIPIDGLLEFEISWPDDELQYKFSNSAKFLEHMNIETFIKVVSDQVGTKYRVATVGEE
jgi:hypothetical protein